jgi:predicted double-glycine peptidase
MTRRRIIAMAAAATLAATAIVGIGGAMTLVMRPNVARSWIATFGGGRYIGPNPGGVQQLRPYDCGPAALRIALLAFGRDATIAELSRDAGTTPDGTSLLGLKQAAERRGITADGWKLTIETLRRFPLPAIAQVDGDHFLVITKIDIDGVLVNDPAIGTVRLSRDAFARRWSGYTLTLKGSV